MEARGHYLLSNLSRILSDFDSSVKHGLQCLAFATKHQDTQMEHNCCSILASGIDVKYSPHFITAYGGLKKADLAGEYRKRAEDSYTWQQSNLSGDAFDEQYYKSRHVQL